MPGEQKNAVPIGISPVHSDADLVAAAQLGNRDAFDLLVTRHHKRVFHIAYRITRNEQDAEDATQIALLKAFSSLPGFQGRSAFSTWLTRIAVNESVMLLRRRSAGPLIMDDSQDENGRSLGAMVADPRPSPEQLFSLSESWGFLAAALDRLNPGLRTAFELHLKGYSGKEIAEALGLSIQAAKTRLSRARQALRCQLAPLLSAAGLLHPSTR